MCGVGFRLLISTAQKCRICEKDVCAKCGLNAVVLQSGLNQREAVWLCKICHEIREVRFYGVPASLYFSADHVHLGSPIGAPEKSVCVSFEARSYCNPLSPVLLF